MAKVLGEYFGAVKASDVHPYGYGEVADFVSAPYQVGQFDWVITNPPFRLGEEFVLRGLSIARVGVAILARTVFIESVADMTAYSAIVRLPSLPSLRNVYRW